MPKDHFESYEALCEKLVRGDDYEIHAAHRNSPVAIIAPHGGCIEPGTSEIAKAIARDDFNVYCFEGLKNRPHHEIHITSHFFNEPWCVDLVSQCDLVVAIHGRADDGNARTVFMGGRHTKLRNAIAEHLERANFPARRDGHDYPAKRPMNICNRGRDKRGGAQLEVPRSLRNTLCRDPSELNRFSDVVRSAIATL